MEKEDGKAIEDKHDNFLHHHHHHTLDQFLSPCSTNGMIRKLHQRQTKRERDIYIIERCLKKLITGYKKCTKFIMYHPLSISGVTFSSPFLSS